MTDEDREFIALVNAMDTEELEALRDLLREIVEIQNRKEATRRDGQ